MVENSVAGSETERLSLLRVRRRPWRWLLGTLALSAIVATSLIFWLLMPRVPTDNSAEAGFARDMITHHEQAVEMALLMRDRTTDPLMRSFTTDIILTQTNQMGQMMGWLDVWRLPLTGLDRPMTWMGHGGQSMPGMASSQEIAELAASEGIEAEIQFLQLMIRHHEGALPMAREILERSDNPVTDRLATSILNAQQNEIDIMSAMLTERDAAPIP
ncbi:MAG: DUF305 domain-containing protein [Chloroflexota bacterium]|nr:DUF305 domain-containing protein [Chloroflexota bacterium]